MRIRAGIIDDDELNAKAEFGWKRETKGLEQ